ncbi:hypothetical protein AAG570_011089 [Ranatra chinensis]|uniref:Uncharacterized protein n=1 Tax=Ranatra chinensis TaxID=642074 RepID=A0ABD0YVU2_9HEMI
MAEKKTLPLTVKTEPGTYKRLPSFRTPRDLKLSEFKQTTNSNESKPKKVYVPNLNIQRRKTEESHSPAGSNDSSKLDRGRRGEERGRGRGRRVPNLVQAGTGIFEQGLAASTKISRWSGGGSSNSSEPTYMQRPKLNLQDNVKINKEEEELVMKELMRDDFLNDPELEPDFDNCPIKLPLQECKLFLLLCNLYLLKNNLFLLKYNCCI